MSSLDEITEVRKRDVDVTLIDGMLKLTPQHRIERLQERECLREELATGSDGGSSTVTPKLPDICIESL